MILDNEIKIIVKSSIIISKLKKNNISSKIGDIIILPIDKLWVGSNFNINVKCDICGNEKTLQYNLYNKNIKKHGIYCCSNKCALIKNKLTCLKKYGNENYVNVEKAKKTKLNKYGNENYINIEKVKKTNLERYGVEHYNNSEKTKKTNLERYGVECVLKLDSIKDIIKTTNLKKYGVEDSRGSDYVITKRAKTNIDRYGVDNYSKTKEYSEKIKNTSMKKYGVDSPNKSDIIKSKKIESMLKKYGCISNSMTDECKKRLRDTNIERYGVEYPMQVLEFFEKQQKNSKKIEYYNEKLYYQGSYEKDFLDYMSSINLLDLVSRGPHINYEYNGVGRSYFPDFYINKYNLIIEIKSHYYFERYIDCNLHKMNTCVELGYNYLFIINKNYKVFDNIINNLI